MSRDHPYDIYAHYGKHLILERDRVRDAARDMFPSVARPWPIEVPGVIPDVVPDVVPVGILGGGVGGLYAAMILQSHGIEYEVLEARDRIGGRLFTKHFDPAKKYDYFDVGAMRFPRIASMSRLFELFKWLDLEDKLIPYIFTTANEYRLFHGKRFRKSSIPPNSEDPFLATACGVDPSYIEAGSEAIMDDVLKPFITKLDQDLESNPPGTEGIKYLLSFDSYSTRSYISHVYTPSKELLAKTRDNPNPLKASIHPPTDVVNWLETMDKSTGWYDRALSESVLEAMSFAQGKDAEWFCLDGGSQVLSDKMKSYLEQRNGGKILTGKRITSISIERTPFASDIICVSVGESPPRRYRHIISTLPLPVLRTLDLHGCNLLPMQTDAMRQLDYGPSIKIGIKFAYPWWSRIPYNIVGGQSFTDRTVRTIVYPSYGKDQTGVLIASYCWTEDANRMGALIAATHTGNQREQDEAKEYLKNLVLNDLAAVHDVPLRTLNSAYLDMFGWNWRDDPYTMGAFAFFGPGKFGNLYDSLTVPDDSGRIHFAGEALSVRHAWVEGALDSSWRAILEILKASHEYASRITKFKEKWGINPEWVDEDSRDHADILMGHIRSKYMEISTSTTEL